MRKPKKKAGVCVKSPCRKGRAPGILDEMDNVEAPEPGLSTGVKTALNG
jgi:hypothetical protein